MSFVKCNFLGVPQAPPPPPIPNAPPLPPPLPGQRAERSGVNASLDILNKMQSRLRSRIQKRLPDKGAESLCATIGDNGDIKVYTAYCS